MLLFDDPTLEEINAQIGGPRWVIARRTPRIVEKYGDDVICLTPKQYQEYTRLARVARMKGYD